MNDPYIVVGCWLLVVGCWLLVVLAVVRFLFLCAPTVGAGKV
jgi:hypothetical protein